MIASDEIATEIVADSWLDEGLADAYGRALAEVHEQYLVQAMRVTETIALLEADGRESWIAGAISHGFSSHIAWEALDRLDLLSSLPLDAFCAGCGAELET